jgi:hypothetical protein
MKTTQDVCEGEGGEAEEAEKEDGGKKRREETKSDRGWGKKKSGLCSAPQQIFFFLFVGFCVGFFFFFLALRLRSSLSLLIFGGAATSQSWVGGGKHTAGWGDGEDRLPRALEKTKKEKKASSIIFSGRLSTRAPAGGKGPHGECIGGACSCVVGKTKRERVVGGLPPSSSSASASLAWGRRFFCCYCCWLLPQTPLGPGARKRGG